MSHSRDHNCNWEPIRCAQMRAEGQIVSTQTVGAHWACQQKEQELRLDIRAAIREQKVARQEVEQFQAVMRFVRDALCHVRTVGHEHEWTPETALRMENRLNAALDRTTRIMGNPVTDRLGGRTTDA